jgi:hypothetical protein
VERTQHDGSPIFLAIIASSVFLSFVILKATKAANSEAIDPSENEIYEFSFSKFTKAQNGFSKWHKVRIDHFFFYRDSSSDDFSESSHVKSKKHPYPLKSISFGSKLGTFWLGLTDQKPAGRSYFYHLALSKGFK